MTIKLENILQDHKFRDVLPNHLQHGRALIVDLGTDEARDHDAYMQKVYAQMKAMEAVITIGRYAEQRVIYDGYSQYQDTCASSTSGENGSIEREGASQELRVPRDISGNNTQDKRDFHIGLDLGVPVGTAVIAPLEGIVYGADYYDQPGDYGGVIVLRHELEGVKFYTLYGHLSKSSIARNMAGKHIKSGEAFATIGDENENGGWFPHLHFQIIKDTGDYKNAYPGVVSMQDKDKYMANCPDPNLILNMQCLKSKLDPGS